MTCGDSCDVETSHCDIVNVLSVCMTARLSECPLCHRNPIVKVSWDKDLQFHFVCPGCGDMACKPQTDIRQAVDDWNAGITPEYVKEVTEVDG